MRDKLLRDDVPFLGFAKNSYQELSPDKLELADLLIVGLPWSGLSSSRFGAFKAPKSIRSYSDLIESFSELAEIDLGEEPHASRWLDLGDLNVKLWWSGYKLSLKAPDLLKGLAKWVSEKGKVLGIIGGDHLITYPVVKTFWELGVRFSVIHLDAHYDLHDEFEGDRFCYATVMRRIAELGISIYQIGQRTRVKEEVTFREGTDLVKDLPSSLPPLDHVYLSIDLDILDPSVIPAVTNPVGAGWTLKELYSFLKELFKEFRERKVKLIGFDVVELNPAFDLDGRSSALASEVLREVIGLALSLM